MTEHLAPMSTAPLALFPSPLEGEGARAEAKPSEGGRGVSFCSRKIPLSRLALRYRSRASHPLPQGERGSALVAHVCAPLCFREIA
jgi:hypothetical protein